jgi:hypothetical protein
LIKKNVLQKQLHLIVIYKKFNFNLKQLIFNLFNIFYFVKLKFKYIYTSFFDMDGLYVRYLPKKRKLHFMELLTDEFSDL